MSGRGNNNSSMSQDLRIAQQVVKEAMSHTDQGLHINIINIGQQMSFGNDSDSGQQEKLLSDIPEDRPKQIADGGGGGKRVFDLMGYLESLPEPRWQSLEKEVYTLVLAERGSYSKASEWLGFVSHNALYGRCKKYGI